ncbi:GNAT family N-acetyltransferase [Actinoplanes sp. DH11]|uniref:GNAT family N-acetyltransferase n=1 Tax=Actinoplanes sp. DH11 TaxID=2857011 RepID=UPI001E4F7CAC|nr:GNAT family N-acetyltransferase [Actinoplanes sp. DH11]
MQIRRATAADADELVRLREVMLRTFSGPDWSDDWRESARRILVRRLDEAEPTMAAFVVDRAEGAGLAACAVGTIEERLGGPGRASGLMGYVFSVVTDPDQRRHGYSRGCVTALLAWFRAEGVDVVDLRASADGEPLYRSLGFQRTQDPAMRLLL